MFGATAVDGRADALGGFRGADLDGAHFRLDDLALEVYVEQAALKRGAGDVDPLGQHEAALELTGSAAAVQIDPALIVGLLATAHQLAVLDLDRAVCLREAGHRDGAEQPVLKSD